MSDFDVCIIGAGPVGLTLALDLSRRGVSCALIDKELLPGPWPKMERCNARTMEIYRRLGVAEAIRARGQAPDGSMDVAIVTSLADPPLVVLRYPTVSAVRADIMRSRDGSLPLEPYQLISQYTLEPILRDAVRRCANVEAHFGSTLLDFNEEADGISVRLDDGSGTRTLSARYLVGCDGGSSTVRKQLGIALEGRGGIGKMHQIFFRSDDLLDLVSIERARHYWFADQAKSVIIVQDDGRHFSLHTTLPQDTDFAAVIRRLAGCDVRVDILNVCEWTMHLLVAESYGSKRVFIAGDAAHLVIPTGGLGMNTGVGDATDLAWKLQAMIAGWGGAALLPSYDVERRAVGRRNRDASALAAAGLSIWRDVWRPNIRENSPEGAATRADIARLAQIAQRRSHEMHGVELGYVYANSPIVCSEIGAPHESDFFHYIPSTSPGCRLPHAWLSDGRAIQDIIGLGHTLLDFGTKSDTAALETAMERIGAPLEIVRLNEPPAYGIYARKLVLVRPDLHVAWRGDELPDDCDAIARVVTGHAASAH